MNHDEMMKYLNTRQTKKPYWYDMQVHTSFVCQGSIDDAERVAKKATRANPGKRFLAKVIKGEVLIGRMA